MASVTPTPRRNSLGCATPELKTPRSNSGRHNGQFKKIRRLSTGPLNFVAMEKEDIISFSSVVLSLSLPLMVELEYKTGRASLCLLERIEVGEIGSIIGNTGEVFLFCFVDE